MKASESRHVPPELRQLRFGQRGLDVLILHGSGARGERHALSDWDLAFLGSADLDVEALRVDLSLALKSDDVDLADLSTASGLLRYRVARDGVLLHEARPGLFQDFTRRATLFWCDIEPVLRRSYSQLLSSLNG